MQFRHSFFYNNERYIRITFPDRAERHDFWPRLWLFFPPFIFPPKKKREGKRRMKSKNRDQKAFDGKKGMTFDHDFCYFIFLFSSLLKKENKVAKIVIKSHTFLFHHAFLLDHFSFPIQNRTNAKKGFRINYSHVIDTLTAKIYLSIRILVLN